MNVGDTILLRSTGQQGTVASILHGVNYPISVKLTEPARDSGRLVFAEAADLMTAISTPGEQADSDVTGCRAYRLKHSN